MGGSGGGATYVDGDVGYFGLVVGEPDVLCLGILTGWRAWGIVVDNECALHINLYKQEMVNSIAA